VVDKKAGDKAGSDDETINEAIEKVKESDFAKTEEGKKVVKKLEDLKKEDKIKFKKLEDTTRGEWSDGEIAVNDSYNKDPETTASELVHEATHAVNEDDFPESKTKSTIDEEMRTNTNQLTFYKEQKEREFTDPELDRRQELSDKGKLRDDIKDRYPGLSEHLDEEG
jgi:hypothetical protein